VVSFGPFNPRSSAFIRGRIGSFIWFFEVWPLPIQMQRGFVARVQGDFVQEFRETR
jgi:hypothetical protein